MTTLACNYFADLAIFKCQNTKLYSCKHFSTPFNMYMYVRVYLIKKILTWYISLDKI